METAPDGAPRCWSRQYQDMDAECKSCGYNFSCRSAFFRVTSQQQQSGPSFALPVMQTPQGYGYGTASQQQPAPMYQPAQQKWQQPATWQPPPPQQVTQQQRPGYIYANMQQDQMNFQQQFHQYPGETVAQRVGKNMLLRAFEAVFMELTRFFHFWPWPP